MIQCEDRNVCISLSVVSIACLLSRQTDLFLPSPARHILPTLVPDHPTTSPTRATSRPPGSLLSQNHVILQLLTLRLIQLFRICCECLQCISHASQNEFVRACSLVAVHTCCSTHRAGGTHSLAKQVRSRTCAPSRSPKTKPPSTMFCRDSWPSPDKSSSKSSLVMAPLALVPARPFGKAARNLRINSGGHHGLQQPRTEPYLGPAASGVKAGWGPL